MKALLVVMVAGTIVTAEAWAHGSEVPGNDTILRTCSPVARYKALNVTRYQPACVISLRHPIEGIVECALRDATLLKIAQPDVEVPDIKDEIDRLAAEGESPVIRYKASLARQVYENPKWFTPLAQADFFTAEEAFAAVAHQLERTLLAARQ